MSSAPAEPVAVEAIVVGAGPAGLLTAGLLARSGVSVAAIGPANANRDDTRTTALMIGVVRLLERIGVWPILASRAQPLTTMRIVDRLERQDHPSVVLFQSGEIGEPSFGSNLANADLVAGLEAFVGELPAMHRVNGMVATIRHETDKVVVETEGAGSFCAPLVIAADGRNSAVRSAAGITARPIDYQQSALTATIDHSLPHADTSTEIHRSGGPLTTVPLPGRRSAIVWLEHRKDAETIAKLDDAGFVARLEAELGGLLGEISLAGSRGVHPIVGLAVSSLSRRRTALVGEAAHVVPPIGAQGLNLGFRDAAEISACVSRAVLGGRDPGGDIVLNEYARARRRDVVSRRVATDLLNRSLLFDSPMLRGVRGLGIALISSVGPLRRVLMREGLGQDRDLPLSAPAVAGSMPCGGPSEQALQ